MAYLVLGIVNDQAAILDKAMELSDAMHMVEMFSKQYQGVTIWKVAFILGTIECI